MRQLEIVVAGLHSLDGLDTYRHSKYFIGGGEGSPIETSALYPSMYNLSLIKT